MGTGYGNKCTNGRCKNLRKKRAGYRNKKNCGKKSLQMQTDLETSRGIGPGMETVGQIGA